MNTIALPDPQNGEPVELHVPEDCPYFHVRCFETIRGKCGQEIIRFDLRLEESIQKEWLPIIAAVAAEWWEEKAKSLTTSPGAWSVAKVKIDNWRRFTAKPK